MTQRSKITVWAIAFFIFFTGYFTYTSELLPDQSAPDEYAHAKALNFILTYRRLPAYPKDKDLLFYSRFGATRSFRPPLIYITTAAVQLGIDAVGLKFKTPYRKGNVLIGGLCAVFLLLSIYIYTHRVVIAAGLTAVFMLMPQISFIFSYLNADGVAIMACSLFLLSIALALKYGITLKTLVFFGFACGIVSLCKLTAWVFCVPVFLFAVVYIFRNSHSAVKTIAIVLISFAITAGWRIGFNIYHHGIENVFNWFLDAQIHQTHAIIKPDDYENYGKLGISYLDLLTNYDNFLCRTYVSTVGELDQLRLMVGNFEYSLYGLVFITGFISCLWVLMKPLIDKNRDKTRHWFELSIIAGGIFQVFMYLYFNINNDIQTQGKYILPALPGLFLLLAAFCSYVIEKMPQLDTPKVKAGALTLLLLGFIYAHLHAWYKYVIPFYNSVIYIDNSPERFTPIAFTDASKLETGDVELMLIDKHDLKYRVTGPDPRVTFKDVNIDTSPEHILLRIRVFNSHDNYYYFYWDDGEGPRHDDVVKGLFPEGYHIMYQILPVKKLKNLRFDLGTPDTRFHITALSYAPLKYKPWAAFLNKMFHVTPLSDTLPTGDVMVYFDE